jgi:uncharacterized alkaline shock family protein YloU
VSRVLVQENGDSVRVSEAALRQIVAGAVSSVDGARLRGRWRRGALELEDGRARAEIAVSVAYGHVLPDVARTVQKRVAEVLAKVCEVTVDAVDVTVEVLDR